MTPRACLLAAILLLHGCSADPDPATPDEDTDVPTDVGDAAPDSEVDADPDDAPDVEVEEDAPVDVRDNEADGPDTPPDVVVDVDTAEPPQCDGRERAVGGLCRRHFDRSCFVDEDCRERELCQWREGEDRERPGTCMYQIPPPLVCPGDDRCPSGDGDLRVGMAARTMTPQGWELPRPGWSENPNDRGFEKRFVGDVSDPSTYCDCGRDMICPPTDEFAECFSLGEWTGPDDDGTEGDGFMQGAWIAGFSNSRNAHLCPEDWLLPECEGPQCCTSRFAHDEIWARAVVMDRGDVRLAWVSLDTVGFFYSDAQRAFADLPEEWGVDWLIVSSTHTHQSVDTIGQWGPGVLGASLPTDTGAIPEWMDDVRGHIVGAVGDAITDLRPADVWVTHVDTGPIGYAVRDTRDPFVFDDRITAVHFVVDGGDRGDPADTIGTIFNWHSHPEAMGDSMLISSDYPHYVRQHLEDGFSEPGVEGFPARPGLGGIAMFVSGTVGGLLNPLHRPVHSRDGEVISRNGYAKARALGERLADLALLALSTPCEGDADLGCVRQLEDESLAFAATEQILDVTNVNFHAGGMGLGVFDRPIYDWRSTDGNIGNVNMPKVRSSVTQIRLGALLMQTFPGELFPEVVTGLRDGHVVRDPILGDWQDVNCAADRRTRLPAESEEERFGCFNDAGNPNPPDLDLFPDGPPLGARLPRRYQLLIGLGNDHVGYLVAPYDFETDPALGALVQAPGDHYEEQVSIGNVVDEVVEAIDRLTELLDEAER